MSSTSAPEYRVLLSTSSTAASTTLNVVVETVREFTSFGYVVALTSVPAPSQQRFDVRIGGIALPSMGRPQPGPARGEIAEPLPADGTYDLVVTRKAQQGQCRITIADGQITDLRSVDEGGLTTFEIGSR